MKIGILGFGLTGYSAARYALKSGNDVFISENNSSSQYYRKLKKEFGNFNCEFNGHSEKLLTCGLIIKSPGIHRDIPIIKKALSKEIRVISEVDFALRGKKPKKILAITGTNGKTTTTALLGEIIKKYYPKTFVCGNIGKPLTMFADYIDAQTMLVIEVSSYQLEDSSEFRPDIAAILNITPEHLDHHKTMRNYITAKGRIFMNQTRSDCCIFNYNDKNCRELSKKCSSDMYFFNSFGPLKRGVYYSRGRFIYVDGKKSRKIKAELKIPGVHNIDNCLAAMVAAIKADVPIGIIEKVIKNFKGVEHRMERVRTFNGVGYINDSKSTNVDSAKAALEALEKNIWLILGGQDKGVPYSPLKKLIKEKVKAVMLIGAASNKIEKDLSGSVKIFHSGTLRNAVVSIAENAMPGDTALLSPACASFDQFKNFEDRGRVFKDLVKKLPLHR